LLLARFGGDGGNRRRVGLLDWLAELERAGKSGRVRLAEVYSLGAFGATPPPGKPNIELWRMERLPLPLRYLGDDDLVRQLSAAIEAAENGRKDLRAGMTALGELLLAPLSDLAGHRRGDAKAISDVVESLDAEARFWSRLEVPFRQLVERLPEDRRADPDGEEDDWIYGEEELPIWADQVARAARSAFREVTDGLGTSGRTLKAVARAEAEFGRRLGGTIKAFKTAVAREGGA
jgi:hypothetical protein